ncbi:DUF6551 family protein [Streptomyces sp. NPDC056670]|uniref:DUF6551 family protein n=1 Tax=Streptomyces sp. NPDC056670 TaxID=3345904 RepID=UPI00368BAA9C
MWVNRKRREGYDERRVGVPTVSARTDGSFVWLDGQNRGELCKAAGHGDTKIRMKVFRGLTLAEEAELFLGLNDNRRVATIYKFLAEVTARRPEALEITRIAEQHGWEISDSGACSIAAVSALSSIYRSSRRPGETLQTVISVVTKAWGNEPAAVNANVLLGLASFLSDCPHINIESLTKKLSNFDGGPSSVLGKGRGMRTSLGCTVTQGVDTVMRMAYNTSRRSGKVPTMWGMPQQTSSAQKQQKQLSMNL